MVLALGAFVFVAEGYRVLTFPAGLRRAPLLDQTQRLAHGQNIYRADLQLPHTLPATRRFTCSCRHRWPGFWVPPLVWAVAFVAGYDRHDDLCRYDPAALTGDRLAALVGDFALRTAIPATGHRYRIDSLALCLSLAALCGGALLPFAEDATNRRRCQVIDAGNKWGSLPGQLPAVRCCWWLPSMRNHTGWLHRWQRSSGTMEQWSAATGAGAGRVGGRSRSEPVCAANVVTGGGFYFNIVTANINEVKLRCCKQYLRRAVDLHAGSGVDGAVCAAGGDRQKSAAGVAATATYIVETALSGLTIGKVGSNINYLLEFCAANEFRNRRYGGGSAISPSTAGC